MAPAADPAARYGPKGDHASAAAAGRDLSDDEEAIEFSFFFEVVSLSFSSSFPPVQKGENGERCDCRERRERAAFPSARSSPSSRAKEEERTKEVKEEKLSLFRKEKKGRKDEHRSTFFSGVTKRAPSRAPHSVPLQPLPSPLRRRTRRALSHTPAMSKAASRCSSSKVELVATTSSMGIDSSSPVTRSRAAAAGGSGGKASASAGAKSSSSSSRFGTQAAAAAAAAAPGGARGSKATGGAGASKKEAAPPPTTTKTKLKNSSPSSSPSSPKYSVLLPTYCEAQNIGIIVSMLVKVFEEK
jgi:hypothetical protein